MPRFLTATLLSALLLAALGCSESPQEKKQRLFDEVIAAANACDFPAAQKSLQGLTDLEPTAPSARFASGYILERQLQHYDALGVYVALTNTFPSFTDAHAGAWRLYTRLGLLPEALREAEALRELLPHDAEAAVILALALIDSNLPRRAHPFLDSAAAEGADPARVAMIRARAFIAADQPNAADSAYEAALVGAGSSPEVYLQAASYLETAGLIDSAVTLSRKAVDLSRGDVPTLQQHFELAVRHNYFAEADRVLARLRGAKIPETVVSMLEAFRYDAARRAMPAGEAIDRVIGLGGGQLSMRMYESAIKTKYSNEIVLLHNIQTVSTFLINEGYDREFQEAVFYLLALQAADWLRGKEALVQWEQIRPMYWSRPHIAARHAWALFESGQFDIFATEVEQIHRLHSSQPEWLAELGDVYADIILHQYDTAAALYERALELNPWHRPAFTGWVGMLRRLDRFDEAAKLFDRYPHFPERFPALAMLEGICLAEAGQPERGLEVYLMNAPQNLGDEAMFQNFFEVLTFRAYREPMRRAAEWIMETGAEHPHILALAAQLRLELGDYPGAIAAADAALKVLPDLLDAKAYRARALCGTGDVDGAIATLRANLDRDQFHVPSTYWLSRILAEQGREPAQAQDFARRALFDSNQGIREWLNLSYVYQVTGRYDLARGEAIKMTRSFAGEPGPLFRLGMALYLENKPDEARLRLQEAIDRGLAGDDLAEARRVLSTLKS
ncbi:MAG TPA: tetratricopeptide repeat protein [candidate division Zixibacteria bacterium]|nr:tetratricopeptide repeat protein [candidate division Zixibacteria bacterium]MDD4917646.1 tetratricopeptide repeat protein [candidate division Zixibacteria bacterium]MDM7974050.1 tetratricopeptide repeat protein [candidate division Zixibacteria bacterium]HOD65536.1 tetratricopeptide repeat protein [candidate division Zixibacteria bacterium]HPC11193.1 tetratricopeptide repeat protein [candidate division Zixibacteria bacterium]